MTRRKTTRKANPLEDEFYKKLGENIIRLRTKKNLWQRELAKNAALSRPSIVSIETGISQPKAYSVYRIAKALDVGIEELMP